MKKKYIIILASVAALVLVLAILEKNHVTNFVHDKNPSTTSGPTTEEKQTENNINSDTKKEFIEDTTKSGSTSSNTQPQSTSIELSANQETNKTVTVFTKLYSITSGNCQLIVSNNDETQTYTAEVIYQAEYSTCAGFSVPVKATGNWSIQLKVISNGQTFNKSISYQVK